MSYTVFAPAGDGDISYTVFQSHGCQLVSGRVPVAEMVALMGVWEQQAASAGIPDDEWVVDALLAEALGVTLVCGSLRDTLAWRTSLGLVI